MAKILAICEGKTAEVSRLYVEESPTRVGQAVAYGDDPFILIAGSEHPTRVDWSILDRLGRNPDIENVEGIARRLLGSGLHEGEFLLGGGCFLYTDKIDWRVELHRVRGDWHSATNSEPSATVTARSFALHDPDRYEGKGPEKSLTVSVGGLYEFQASSFAVFPSCDLSALGWTPNPQRPTELLIGPELAAWYETVHGPTSGSVHLEYRFPLVGRWLASEAGWAAVRKAFGEGLREKMWVVPSTVPQS